MSDFGLNPLNDYYRIKQLKDIVQFYEDKGKKEELPRLKKGLAERSIEFKRIYGVSPEEWDMSKYFDESKKGEK